MEIFPWQSELWGSLMSIRQRMPHALLLQGRAGTGKVQFASTLAQSLLCDTPTANGIACGACPSCGWFLQGNHPDFRLLEPEDAADSDAEDGGEQEGAKETKSRKKHRIAVHQVRALGDFFNLSTHRQGLRIVLLHPAESLNPASANALLKMLEEPPPATLFILVTHQPQLLLPTIRSRCNKVTMPPPSRQMAEQWLAAQGIQDCSQRLAYVGGSPLAAVSSDEETEARRQTLFGLLGQGGKLDPFAASALCSKDGMAEVIASLQKWGYDLLAAKLSRQVRYHVRLAASMQALAKSVDLAKLLGFQRALGEARGYAQHPLNAELQLESLLIQYIRMFPSQSRA
ncbi:MAG: DNA polymerase III subunit delta' [Nitrosomonadales bacterium]|nr:MAG: DNA polymerase III subunit delta' [Nitrosomonadales bacterium]